MKTLAQPQQERDASPDNQKDAATAYAEYCDKIGYVEWPLADKYWDEAQGKFVTPKRLE